MALRDVIGQQNALRILLGAMARGRVASSYLFAGEDGIGKRFAAINFAKALNCHAPVSGLSGPDACERCASCTKINAGTHPDFRVVVPDGEQIKVEQVREVEEVLSLKSFEGGMKMIVVDEAERMNSYAANSFLKTLEEPTPDSLIVLVSSNPDWLPMTIRSRTSRVNFNPLGAADCEAVIRREMGKTKKPVDVLVRLAMGRPGRAISDNPIKERDWFLKTLGQMLSRQGKHQWRERRDMRRWLQMAQLYLRDLAVMNISGGTELIINLDVADELKQAVGNANVQDIVAVFQKVSEMAEGLRFNPNRAVLWNYAGGAFETAGINA